MMIDAVGQMNAITHLVNRTSAWVVVVVLRLQVITYWKKNPNIPRDICGLTIYNMCSYSDKKYTTKAEQKGICLQKGKRSA